MLPDCKVGNFTTDWNNGVNLNALVDYCKPGLAPNWQNLDPNKGCVTNVPAKTKHCSVISFIQYEFNTYFKDVSLICKELSERNAM